MSQKTIWHVISASDPISADNGSAVQSVARRLIAESNKRGRYRGVLVTGVEADRAEGIEPILAPSSRSAQLRAVATRYLPSRFAPRGSSLTRAESSPDAIVLHNQHALIPAFKGHFPKVPLVVYAHNEIWQRVPAPVARTIMRDASGLICVSRDLQQAVLQQMKRLPAKTEVIHSGVDVPDGGRSQPAWDVVFVGRTIPSKGVHVLIDALSLLAERGEKPSALIVGSSWFYGHARPKAYELEMRAQAERDGLNVQFSTAVPPGEVPGILDSARIAVVPSVWREPLGLTALEGMASRSALVYSGIGGIPEVASGGGMQVRAGDAADLAGVLSSLMADEALRESVARAGQARAKELTWARAAVALDRFLDEVI